MAVYARLTVNINTSAGLIARSGDGIGPLPGDQLELHSGMVTYPDRRVQRFDIEVSSVSISGPWTLHTTLEASKAPGKNLSYALVEGGVIDLSTGGTPDPPLSATSDYDEDGTRLYVSDIARPRSVYARRAAQVGYGSSRLVAFAAQTAPLSTGQFGEHPVIAFADDSVWALVPGRGDVAFVSIVPVDLANGLLGRNALVNAEGRLFFMSKDGLRVVGEDRTLSEEVQDALLADLSDVRMGYLPRQGRRAPAIYISTGGGGFGYSFEGGWFERSRQQGPYLTVRDRLYSIDGSDLVSEDDLLTAQSVNAEVAGLHMGIPGVLRRLTQVTILADGTWPTLSLSITEDGKTFLNVAVLASTTVGRTFFLERALTIDPALVVSGQGIPSDDVLRGFFFDSEADVPHRMPVAI